MSSTGQACIQPRCASAREAQRRREFVHGPVPRKWADEGLSPPQCGDRRGSARARSDRRGRTSRDLLRPRLHSASTHGPGDGYGMTAQSGWYVSRHSTPESWLASKLYAYIGNQASWFVAQRSGCAKCQRKAVLSRPRAPSATGARVARAHGSQVAEWPRGRQARKVCWEQE